MRSPCMVAPVSTAQAERGAHVFVLRLHPLHHAWTLVHALSG